MKKIAGLLTVLALLVSVCGISAYAFEDDEWIFEYADGCEKSEDIYGSISRSGAIGGKNGLYLYNNLTDTAITAKSSEISFKGGTEYTLTMRTAAERSYDVGAFKLGIDGVMAEKNVARMTTVSQSGGYKTVSATFAPDADITSRIALYLNSRYKNANTAAHAIVDDIVISDGTEEIYTCTFENIDNGGDSFLQAQHSTEQYPTNVTATGWYGAIGLSWVNPTASGLEKIVVSDDSTGEIIADSDSTELTKGFDREATELSVVSGDVNVLWVYDCELDVTRTFRLKFIYSGESFNNFTEYKISAAAKETYDEINLGFSGYSLALGLQKDYRFNTMSIGVDGENAYTGEKSMKVSINASGNDDSYIELMSDASLPLLKGKTYRVSMWLKGENVTSINYMSNWSAVPGANAAVVGTYDWKEFTYDVTPDSDVADAAFRWRFYGRVGALWMDNITVYELDENLNPIGENLMEYGDFEDGYKSPTTADVNNAAAESLGNGVWLDWSLPEKEILKIKIYEIGAKGKTNVAALDGESTGILLNGASFDTEHTYLITTVNSTGFESEGVECGIYHSRQKIVCSDITLQRDGLYVSDISKPGEYTVAMSFATDEDTEQDTEFFVMYTDGGMLKQSDFKPGKIGADSMKTVECTINIEDPTDTDLLKVFLWNSIEKMDAITNSVQFE